MSGMIYPVLLAIVVILVIVGIAVVALVWRKKKEGKPVETDYRVFFILGVCWFPLGIVFMSLDNPMGYVFFILGLVYLVIGLVNRDKWKKE